MDIEKNVAMPKPASGRGAGDEQTGWGLFKKMEVGDSVVVDGENASSSKCRAMVSARVYGKYYGAKFSGRKIAPGKVRIWRVK